MLGARLCVRLLAECGVVMARLSGLPSPACSASLSPSRSVD